jgi:hypothetical protein
MATTSPLIPIGQADVVTDFDRPLLRLGAMTGVAGMALRFLASDRSPSTNDGVGLALVGALGAAFLTFALIVLYRSTAARDIARIASVVGVVVVLAAAVSGIEFALDGALVGSVFLAIGAAVAVGRTYPAWLGWLGAAAGIGLIAGAFAGFHGGLWNEAAAIERSAAAVAALFILAASSAMWRRSFAPSTSKGATQA